jgi:hypothetical protein
MVWEMETVMDVVDGMRLINKIWYVETRRTDGVMSRVLGGLIASSADSRLGIARFARIAR